MIKILISDSNYDHAIGVRDAILSTNAVVLSEIAIRVESLSNSLAYASANGIYCVVRSTTGVSSYETLAYPYYLLGIQVFMPLGSNSSVALSVPSSIQNIITTGAGTPNNNTAFGLGLELHDDDNGTPDDASSFSNGVIAGKLFKIKTERNCDWWEARYCARMTASGGGTWNQYNGYGIINVNDAIHFTGEVPSDPFSPSTPEDEPIPEEELMAIKRQTILDLVKARFETILVSNGFHTNLGQNVQAWRLTPFETNEKNGINIWDQSQSLVEENSNPNGVHVYDLDLTVNIIAQNGENTITEVRRGMADVSKAIKSDKFWSGNAMQTFYKSDQIIIDRDEKTIGGAEIKFVIRYSTTAFTEE